MADKLRVLKRLGAVQGLPYILPLLGKMKNRDYSVQDLAQWFVASSATIRCWIVLKDNIPVSYVIAYVTVLPSDAVHITESFSESVVPKETGQAVMEDVGQWAKSLGKRRIMMVTQRDPEAFERRHGFKLHSYLMEREVV